jgi:zinc protease
MEKYPRYIESVTPEDIKRVAQRYLDTENYVLVVVGDKKKTGIGK